MRTTRDTSDDVLMAVKDRAQRQKGKKTKSFYGFDPLPSRGEPVANELIDKLREGDAE